jgi:hypothetical protein
MSGTFKQHDERDTFGQREFCKPVSLRRTAGSNRTRQHREVLSADHHWSTVYAASASNDAIARNLAYQRSKLSEGSRIKEVLDARTSIELAFCVFLREAFFATHRSRRSAALREIIKGRAPPTGKFRWIRFDTLAHGFSCCSSIRAGVDACPA